MGERSAVWLRRLRGRSAAGLLAVPAALALSVGALIAPEVASAVGPMESALPGGALVAVTPARLLDTRVGVGYPVRAVGAGQTVAVQIAGRGGVPVVGASAVSLTLTVTGSTHAGFVTAFADHTARPGTSNLNFTAGATVAGGVIVGLGDDGVVDLYNGSAGTIELIADVTGYARSGSGSLAVVTPTRLLDTRGPGQSAVSAHGVARVQVRGRAGVPATAAAAVVTITVTGATAGGYVTAYPTGTARPPTSNVNFGRDGTVANLAVTGLGSDGAIDVYNSSAGSIQVIVDVAGYVVSGVGSAAFAAVPTARVLDTRAQRAVASGQALVVSVGGRAGVPTGASAALLNLTVTNPSRAGYVAADAAGTAQPLTSVLNFRAGQTVAASAVVSLSSDGELVLYNRSAGAVQFILDVQGYTQPGQPSVAASPSRSEQGDVGHSGVINNVGLVPPLAPAWAVGGLSFAGQAVFGAGAVYVPWLSDSEGEVTAMNEADGSRLWGPVAIGGGSEGLSYDAGRVFTVDYACHLTALDATSGQRLWGTAALGADCDAPPTATGGVVYLAAFDALTAVSETTGRVLWTVPHGGDHSSPAYVNGEIIIDPSDLQVWSINAQTGALDWHHGGPGEGGGGRLVNIAGGLIYARPTDLHASADIFEASSGTLVGSLPSDGPLAVDAANSIAVTSVQKANFVGCGTSACTLVARSLTDGAVLWTFAGDTQIDETPLIVDGVVYVDTFYGNIVGLDEATGQLVWSADLRDTAMPYDEQNATQPPPGLSAADGLLIASTRSGVVAFASSSPTTVAPVEHRYSGTTLATCSEQPAPVSSPTCSWPFTQYYAGADEAHLTWNPAYHVQLTARIVDTSGHTLASAASLSGDAYLTTGSLPSGHTYRLEVTGPPGVSIGYAVRLREAVPNIGTGSQVTLSAASLPFGTLPVESTRSESLTVRNTGDHDVVLGPVTLNGAAAYNLSFDACSDARLAPDWTCTITITVNPTQAAPAAATLRITANGNPRTVSITLTGTP